MYYCNAGAGPARHASESKTDAFSGRGVILGFVLGPEVLKDRIVAHQDARARPGLQVRIMSGDLVASEGIIVDPGCGEKARHALLRLLAK